MSIYNFKVNGIGGKEVSLNEYKDQVLLIVNVASQCGFTPQYEGLEALYQKFKDKKFSILGFPCNQFASQEPGNEDEIKNFCDTKFHVTFPLFAKIDVNGDHTHPLYEFLKKEEKGIFGTTAIKWNFTKFLVDRSGNVISRFAPQTTPAQLEKDVEKLL